jgi:hypothetical protein
MGDNCFGSQGPQRTVALEKWKKEKKKNKKKKKDKGR